MLRKLALFMVLAIIAAGCSEGAGESTAGAQVQATSGWESGSPRTAKVGGKRDASVFLDVKDTPASYSFSSSEQPKPSTAPDRAVIRGANVTVRVEKLDDAEKKVQNAIKASGGYELTLTSTDLAGPNAQLSISAKVPVGKLDEVIGSIEGLGTRVAKTISMQDVTENLATYDAQISALRSDEAKLKKQGASNIDPGTYQYQLQAIQSQMASIQSQRAIQTKAAAFSTLELTLRQGAVPGAHDPNWLAEAYGQSSASASNALRIAATGILWLVFMSPFYMPFVAGGWLVYRMQKRKLSAQAPRVVNVGPPPSMQQV